MYWSVHFKTSQEMHQHHGLSKQMSLFLFNEDLPDTSLSSDLWPQSTRRLVADRPRDHAMKPTLDAIPNTEAAMLFVASVFGLDDSLELFLQRSRGGG